ncbi:MAG: tetratricopeptide repeat protein [Cyanobacteria bacterium REEB65]|nr:tetratricopeptide repeat protein [Cyanobacteria bacterium REEB65]
MGFVIRQNRPRLRSRLGLAKWRDRPGAAVWLLVCGPGSGKTCAAWLLAEDLCQQQLVFEADPTRDDLAPLLGAQADTSGPDLARRFNEYLAREYVEGVAIVFDAVERALADPRFAGFLEAWLVNSSAPWLTLVTSRLPLPFGLARRAAAGEIALLGRRDLWLSDEEARNWTADQALDAALLKQLMGWPLGVNALLNLGGSGTTKDFQSEHLLQELATQELLSPLPRDLNRVANRLGAMPIFDPSSLGAFWTDSDWQAVCLQLAEWGLLVGAGARHLGWYSPARTAAGKGWQEATPKSQRYDQVKVLYRHLLTHDPQAALALAVEQTDWEQGLAALEAINGLLYREGEFRELLGWLARFPDEYAQSHGVLNLVAGKLLGKSDAGSEALARLTQAAELYRKAGDSCREFEALNALLPLHIDRNELDRASEIFDQLRGSEEGVSIEQKLKYQRNLAAFHLRKGNIAAARSGLRAILNHPHFDIEVVAVLQQVAALHLGEIEVEDNGDLLAARQLFLRASKLAQDWPARSSVGFEAALQLGLIDIRLGHRHSLPPPVLESSDRYSGPEREYLLALEGDYHLLADSDREAALRFGRALEGLGAKGQDVPLLYGYCLGRLAAVARRNRQVDKALRMHEEAYALVRSNDREAAIVLIEWAITCIEVKECRVALARLTEAIDRLAGGMAPHRKGEALLIRAVASYRLGADPAAMQDIRAAARFLRQGPHEFALVRWREIAPDLWHLMERAGERELLDSVAERFPAHAQAIRNRIAGHAPDTVQESASLRVSLRCFGSLELQVGDDLATWPRKKARAMLAHLLLARAGLSPGELGDRLFGGDDPVASVKAVRVLISNLRKTFEPGLANRDRSRFLLLRGGRYQLERREIDLDLEAFDRATDEGQRNWRAGNKSQAAHAFEEALLLYRGDLFDDGDLLEWFDLERHHYRNRVVEIRHKLADFYLSAGQFEEGRTHLLAILALDPTDEQAHCGLMRLYAQFGQWQRLHQQYDLMCKAFQTHLDRQPTQDALGLFAQLKATRL